MISKTVLCVADYRERIQCTAVDRDNMRAVLGSVNDIILRNSIEAAVSPRVLA